jgi:hypothetical protein
LGSEENFSAVIGVLQADVLRLLRQIPTATPCFCMKSARRKAEIIFLFPQGVTEKKPLQVYKPPLKKFCRFFADKW